MRRSFIGFAGIVAGGSVALAACSNSSSTEPPATTSSSSSSSGAGGSKPAAPSITPSPTANVLTCSTLQFKETGGTGDGSWSATPAGTIDKAGLFTAPLTAAVASTTIKYAETDGSASSIVTLATAFLGPVATLPAGQNPDFAGGHAPFEHAFTANGSRVYTAIQNAPTAGGPFLEADLFVSNDSGKTFTPAAVYHTGKTSPGCVTAAVDAGSPDVVYLAYYGGHGDSTGNTGTTLRLAVSTDGAKTFPKEYILADSINSMAELDCPDVISPSADHVVVSGIGVKSPPGADFAATWVSGNRGADIGPVGTQGVAGAANPADPNANYATSETNSGSAEVGCNLNSNNGSAGPRLFTNGAGNVCVGYVENAGCTPANAVYVQCSADNGKTWTARQAVDTPTGVSTFLFGAVSKSGNVALTWLSHPTNASEVMVAFSKDGGKTFGKPIQYPSASRDALVAGSYTYEPVVAWESDSVLWLSQTLNGSDSPVLMVDKTCDFGVSWSGAVNAGAYKGTTLLSTAAGMVATGYGKGTTNVVTVPLEQTGP